MTESEGRKGKQLSNCFCCDIDGRMRIIFFHFDGEHLPANALETSKFATRNESLSTSKPECSSREVFPEGKNLTCALQTWCGKKVCNRVNQTMRDLPASTTTHKAREKNNKDLSRRLVS
jgi:hypothetical protein